MKGVADDDGRGDIVTPYDAGYQNALSRWAANSVRNAAVIAFVSDVKDVALAVGHARASGMNVTIRGGGCSDDSSSEGGLVIDLSRCFNNVRIDPGLRLAYVQGGASCRTVDYAAARSGLATVTSTVNHVRGAFSYDIVLYHLLGLQVGIGG